MTTETDPIPFGWFDIPAINGHTTARLGLNGTDGELAQTVRTADGHVDHVELCRLPTVVHRLVCRDPAGQMTDTLYALQWQDGTRQTVASAALTRQDTWASQIPLRDQKGLALVARAIIAGSEKAGVPLVNAAAGWDGDTYRLPPDGYRPDGIAEVTADEESGRAAWRDIIRLAQDSPKIALVAGAALGGLYVSRLGREPFTLHLVGDSREGKTTALRVAGAVLGNPARTVFTWDTTPIALTEHLGQLSTLPAVVDELGAAGLRSESLESLVFRISGGGGRRRAHRYGPGTRTSGTWAAVLISSGNRGLSNLSANPGLPVRAVDLPTPITDSPVAADQLTAAARTGAGWPIRWHLEDSRLDHFTACLARAEAGLPVAGGGPLGTIARHLALCVAGAEVLGWHVAGRAGAQDLRITALAAAADHLKDIGDEITAGGRMADRLVEAVLEAEASRPYAVPTQDEYDDPRRESLRPVEMVDLGGGRLAVFPKDLRRIAAEHDIEDPTPALRDLRRRGVLEIDRGDGLAKRVRLRHARRVRMYVFRTEHPALHPQGGTSGTSMGPGGGTSEIATNPQVATGGTSGTSGIAEFPYTRPVDNYSARELRALLEVAEERERREAEAETARLAAIYEKPALGALRTPQRTPEGLEQRRQAFARAATDKDHPPPPDDLVAEALDRFETAARFAYRPGSPARNGLMWLFSLTARYGSVPTLYKEAVPLPGPRDKYRPEVHHSMVDRAQADRDARQITGYDVNAAFLNVERLELGTGTPQRIAQPTADDLRHPGFVVIANPQPDWPHPFRWSRKPRPVPVTTGQARLLASWTDEARFVDAHIWTEHRSWMRNFCRHVRAARGQLLDQHDDPGQLALVVLKQIYAATLGGILGSEKHNPTGYYRPDWMWIIRGHVTVSLWRQLHQTSPGPAAVNATDAVYYLHDPDPPPALEISTRPGKFKVAAAGPLTDDLRSALRAGRTINL